MSPRSRFIIFLTVIVGLALLLVLIFGRKKPSSSTTKSITNQPASLVDYANRDSKVVFVVDGPIIAEEDHRSVRITVGRGSRTLEIIKGYQNNVIESHRFDNNKDAYKTFLYAIARYNFAKKRTTKLENVTGACPQSQRYLLQLYDNNDKKQDLWTATCTKGTSGADYAQIRVLFQKQIPDYSKLLGSTQL